MNLVLLKSHPAVLANSFSQAKLSVILVLKVRRIAKTPRTVLSAPLVNILIRTPKIVCLAVINYTIVPLVPLIRINNYNAHLVVTAI